MLARLTVLLLAALLAGCATAEFAASPPSTDAGVFVSRAQGMFDWASLQQRRPAFAYMAATEGGDMVDLTFARNWKKAGAAGLNRGALHRFQLCRAPEEQAEWFKLHVPQDQAALPPAVEIGWDLMTPLCLGRPSRASVVSDLNLFLYELERHYGKRPVIRTSGEFRRDMLAGEFGSHGFWLNDVSSRDDGQWALRRMPGSLALTGANAPAERIAASGRAATTVLFAFAGL